MKGKLKHLRCDFCDRGLGYTLYQSKCYCIRCWKAKMVTEHNFKFLKRMKKKNKGRRLYYGRG